MNTCLVIIATTSSIFWAADLNLTPESEKQTVSGLLKEFYLLNWRNEKLVFLFGFY